MISNCLKPVDQTVHTLIDRSYPVVKTVYLNLDKINSIFDKLDSLDSLYNNLGSLTVISDAADRVNRVQESIDNIDLLTVNATDIDNLAQSIQSVTTVADSINDVKGLYSNIKNVNSLAKISDKVSLVADYAQEVSKLSEIKDQIVQVANNKDNIHIVSSNSQYINVIAGDIIGGTSVDTDSEDYGSVIDSLNPSYSIIGGTLKTVADNIESIRASLANAENAKTQALLAKAQASQTSAPVEDDLYGAKYYAQQAANTSANVTQVVDEVNQAGQQQKAFLEQTAGIAYDTLNSNVEALTSEFSTFADQREEDLLNISGTYYIPSVSDKGIISWTNTGGRTNPSAVDIKGPKGDPGTGLKLNGQYTTYAELVANHPVGTEGDAYQIADTGDIWIWDIIKEAQVNLGQLRGAKGDTGESADTILMSPDPVEYFLSIYGD